TPGRSCFPRGSQAPDLRGAPRLAIFLGRETGQARPPQPVARSAERSAHALAVHGVGPARDAPPLRGAGWPTVLHVTHAKAGSQWLYKILHQCAPERIVAPQYEMVQFVGSPVRAGKIYPTLYVTREQLEGVALSPGARRFVIIRDLRDTLV